MDYRGLITTKGTFRVKDLTAFRDKFESLPHGLEIQTTNGAVWIGGYDATTEVCDEEGNTTVDILDLISRHLAPGETAMLHEVGYEGLRYFIAVVYLITPDTFYTMDAFVEAEEAIRNERRKEEP